MSKQLCGVWVFIRVNPQHHEIFCIECLVISYFGINLDDIHRCYLFGTSSDY